ncbi:hypothetical protein ACFYVL_42740 [Streptomyces sp. NPDC004111]|uniref:hypothetical protein n=1 Tax=Streptomyces sp. NPDC004111 TaxID=3364690 RepID=UPI0036CBA9B7
MRRTASAATALAALIVLAAGAPATLAHTAQNSASPRSVTTERCRAPQLPPVGEPLVVDPDSVKAPSGTSRPVSDRATYQRVASAVRNFAGCMNAGDHLRAAPLLSAHFVKDFMGQDSYQTVPDVLGGLRIEHLRIGEIRAYADGSFTTDLRYLAYGHQLAHVKMNWWKDRRDGFLKVNGLEALDSPVAPEAQEVRVEMGEYFFRLDRTTVRAPHGSAVLRLTNIGKERHEAILLRLPEGATGADLFNGKLSPKDVTTVAQENGGDELSLVGLTPGTYTLVDFIPAADGKPNGMHGQTAQFTVTR